ncbi:hypothetical protein ACFE04_010107 [Oxalis oulophora]
MSFGGPPLTVDTFEEANDLERNIQNQSAIAEIISSKILDLCILHLAMSEITVVGTRHQIVINEVVDLAKCFCNGAAPRIINGCLGTFIKGLIETESLVEPKQQVSVEAVKSLT